jgi:hypothetical protein
MMAALIVALSAAAPAMQSGRISQQGRRHFGPPPSSPGPHTMLAAPQLRDRETGGRDVTVAPDAIVASETYVIAAARMATVEAIHVGAPFDIGFPAGSIVVVRTGDPGQARCLVTDQPLRDGQGRTYTDACLLDRDRDGRFEALRFLAEDKDPPSDAASAPVALRALPPELDPRLTWFLAERRLRVARIDGDRAIILTEARIGPGGSEGLGWRATAGPGLIAMLRLRAGERATLGGLRLMVQPGADGGWRIVTEGGFAPWLVLRDHDTMVDTGLGTMQAD